MIISASRRTDIPAFFPEWCVRRFEAGEVLVRHPMNTRNVSRVPLDPEGVDCIVFWTKDPRPLIPLLDRLDLLGHSYYFLFTLTPYGGDVERRIGRKKAILDSFTELSERLGSSRVVWRYDPILLTGTYSREFHLEQFAALAEALEGRTERCIVSFFEPYAKLQKRMAGVDFRLPDEEEQRFMLRRLAEESGRRNIELSTCAKDYGMESSGVRRGKCIDDGLIRRITGKKVTARKDPSQRSACGCVMSRDIGAYGTCLHECLYCYASGDERQARSRYETMDPDAPLLGPRLTGSETILEPGRRSRSAEDSGADAAAEDPRQNVLPGLE